MISPLRAAEEALVARTGEEGSRLLVELLW